MNPPDPAIRSLKDLGRLFYALPLHQGDQKIADNNLALLRAAHAHAASRPLVPFALTDADRVFLKSIRVAA